MLENPEISAESFADLAAVWPRLERGLGVACAAALQRQTRQVLTPVRNGDFGKWQAALDNLPLLEGRVELNSPCPSWQPELPAAGGYSTATNYSKIIESAAEVLGPWRKGPYQLGQMQIDSEWNSAIKWQRFAADVNLKGQRVLDVGAANGYFSLRALGAGAAYVLGLEPSFRSIAQWRFLQHFYRSEAATLLPLRLEQAALDEGVFDVAFSLGVLYHQRDPLAHLGDLKRALVAGGSLLLETLIVEGEHPLVLQAKARYASMRNVFTIPTPQLVTEWLATAGFQQIRCLDRSCTTPEEQRSTPFMRGPSLSDFLDAQDPSRTVEGHPAPRRGLWLAQAG